MSTLKLNQNLVHRTWPQNQAEDALDEDQSGGLSQHVTTYDFSFIFTFYLSHVLLQLVI